MFHFDKSKHGPRQTPVKGGVHLRQDAPLRNGLGFFVWTGEGVLLRAVRESVQPVPGAVSPGETLGKEQKRG